MRLIWLLVLVAVLAPLCLAQGDDNTTTTTTTEEPVNTTETVNTTSTTSNKNSLKEPIRWQAIVVIVAMVITLGIMIKEIAPPEFVLMGQLQ
jgi:beta-lactamase regulating signal transducer with metallopeptidase domain